MTTMTTANMTEGMKIMGMISRCVQVGFPSLLRLGIVWVGLACICNTALAQIEFIWDGGGADYNWATSANWQGDVAPTLPSTTTVALRNTLTFSGMATTTNNNTVSSGSAYGMKLENDNSAGKTAEFRVQGNKLFFRGGIIENAATVSGTLTDTIALNLEFGGSNQKFLINEGHNLVFSGILSGTGSRLWKDGLGIMTVMATNTYGGRTVIDGGTLVVTVQRGISNTSTYLTIAEGATCDVSNVEGFVITANKEFSGFGTLVGNATLYGTLSPGTANTVGSVGKLRGDSFTFATNSSNKVDCVAGVADELELTGSVTVDTQVTVAVTYTGELPARVKLVTAPMGIVNPGNLQTWTVTGAKPVSMVIWDEKAKAITLLNHQGTLISFK